MLTGITDEILRLEYTAAECRKQNPYKLDIQYMEDAARALRAYRDLHPGQKPLPLPEFS